MTATTPAGVIAPQNDDSNEPRENNFAAPAEANQQRGGKQSRQGQPRRDKFDVHGWVILDKPIGMTSTHAVAVVKRLFSAKRAGHAGTLDPLATGGLPIALGEATKTVPYVMDGRKRIASRSAGVRNATPTTPKAAPLKPAMRARTKRPFASCCRSSPARSSKPHLNIRPSRSRASGPTTWRETAKSCRCSRARSKFTN